MQARRNVTLKSGGGRKVSFWSVFFLILSIVAELGSITDLALYVYYWGLANPVVIGLLVGVIVIAAVVMLVCLIAYNKRNPDREDTLDSLADTSPRYKINIHKHHLSVHEVDEYKNNIKPDQQFLDVNDTMKNKKKINRKNKNLFYLRDESGYSQQDLFQQDTPNPTDDLV